MNKLVIFAIMAASVISAAAQESTNTGVRRASADAPKASTARSRAVEGATSTYGSLSEGDVQWMRVLYRELDLDRGSNAALYFPEDIVDGQKNLFRIILDGLLSGELAAYEYLDGKEIFTDQYRVDVAEMLDRFDIPRSQAKGSTDRRPRYAVDEADVPCTEVESYYIIERNTFDNRQSRLKTTVEAICPVLHRVGDFGGEPLKYPMFWIKYADLQPLLVNTAVFIADDNNLPAYSYADFFNLGKYQGDIYKTRNLRNKSMAQLYPDSTQMNRARDSIQASIDGFEDKLWVPDREEIIGSGNSSGKPDQPKSSRKVTRSSQKAPKAKVAKNGNAPARSVARSVRRRK